MRSGFHTDTYRSAYLDFDRCVQRLRSHDLQLIECGSLTARAGRTACAKSQMCHPTRIRRFRAPPSHLSGGEPECMSWKKSH